MVSTYNSVFALSDSEPKIHFEKHIEHTQLGQCFNKVAHDTTQLNIVASYICFNGDWVSLYIKARDVEGGHFGCVEIIRETDIRDIQNELAKKIWNSFLCSLKELKMDPPPQHFSHLQVSLYDFCKSSRIGFFMQYSKELQEYIQEKFPLVKIYIRYKDDETNFYYMIFETAKDQALAESVYGIQNIINCVYEFCIQYDTYHVFDSFVPFPHITTKVELEKNGEMMQVIRDNPNFKSNSF